MLQQADLARPRAVWRRVRGAVAILLIACPVAADPLAGKWVLNLARTHYGIGTERRQSETFDCQRQKQQLRCSIQSVRAGGRQLIGRFIAAYDGRRYSFSGIPDVNEVSLSKVDEFIADATFTYNGAPVFGYRSIKSDDGRSLTIVSVDPVTRKVLHSVVVYDRR